MRWGVVLALACGAPSANAVLPASDQAVFEEAAGAQIVALPRATEGRIWLSLWIDAGARDADPPQVSTLAAWSVEGDGITARVLPDGTELSRACTRDALGACIDSFARAVGRREISDQRERLARSRERAADDRRAADALALEALLGSRADPLGSAADDGRADDEAVRAFLDDHYGTGRLLVIAIGDLTAIELRTEVERAFGDIPPARAPRADRVSASPRTRVEIGDRSVVAVAALRPSIADAAHVARRVLARVAQDAPDAVTSADVFPLRGGAAVLARIDAEPEQSAILIDHFREIADAPPIEGSDPMPDRDGPQALARWIGARWAARGQPSAPRIAIGAIVAGGRADAVGDDPDGSRRRDAERSLGELADRAPQIDGRIESESADVELANGARARVRRLHGASRSTAIAIFDGGPAEDPRDAHGATAVLATLASISCEAIARRELGQTLEALAMSVDAILLPGAWGLRVEGPSARWRELAFLAARCPVALDPSLFEAAREAVIADASTDAGSSRALLGELLSPLAPGRVAPLGRPDALGSLSRAGLARLASARTGGRRGRIAFAGDAPVEDVVRSLARGVMRWPAGTAVVASPWEEPSAHLASEHRGERIEAVVAWLIDADEPAAQVFAAGAARALDGDPALESAWHEAGASGGRAWAAVGLEPTADAVDGLPDRVARALAAAPWADVARAASEVRTEEGAWRSATPRAVATELAMPHAELGELEPVLARFAASTPYFVIVRPRR